MSGDIYIELQHAVGWAGAALAAFYFSAVSLALRWRPKTQSRVATYEPPKGVSPATACYVLESGATNRPFAVALVNMAAKGYLRIEQGPTDYLLTILDASVPLETEEQIIAERLFRRGDPFTLSESRNLGKAAQQVLEFLESTVEPDLISRHFPFFVPGLTLSLWCFGAALFPEMQILWDSHGVSGLIVPAGFSFCFLLATIKTVPALICKLASLLPGRSPYRMRFVAADSATILLLAATLASLAVIGWATSTQFALQFGSLTAVNVFGWMALRASTPQGRTLLHELSNFRTFFATVDSDRINRNNAPNTTSPATERLWGWALALGIEHTWGEQFAAAVLNRIGLYSAVASIEANLPEERRVSGEVIDLHLPQ